MPVMEKSPPTTPFLREVREILEGLKPELDQLESKVELLVQQWHRAESRGDRERLETLEPQRAEIRARLARIEEIIRVLDELELGQE